MEAIGSQGLSQTEPAAGPRTGARGSSLVFVGFMGAGKSAAARVAAAELGRPLIDADHLLEEQLGQPIADFFDRHGEGAFREREEALVLSLLDGGGEVIALGGGAVESDRVRAALGDHLCVWCNVDLDTAWERSGRSSARPLARDWEEFRRRYADRAPLYEEIARVFLPADARAAVAGALPWIELLFEAPETRMVWAPSASGEYPAIFGNGAAALLAGLRRWFVVADREALHHHRPLLPAAAEIIEASGGEDRKTLAEAERIWSALVQAGARRSDGSIAFGGGVVGDLAGFCAATYQRGMAVVQMPTTLVAQVDSAYGGKTGVDLPDAKNYVGAYHQPMAVVVEPRTLDSLPAEELAAGFAEALKTALIAGGALWERVRRIDRLDPVVAGSLALPCARVKIDVVAEDERDEGRRAVLNLGHTVGHAIETATGYRRYRHGEAIGLGLLASLRLSGADDLREEVEGLLAVHRLPVALDPIPLDDLLAAINRDKKRTDAAANFVLLERPGDPLTGCKVEEADVRAAVEELMG